MEENNGEPNLNLVKHKRGEKKTKEKETEFC